MEKIIKKIKKLMAIAEDPSASDQEIQLATYRANKLMIKHKITEFQLDNRNENNKKVIQKLTEKKYTGYLYWTFSKICKNNQVGAYFCGRINSRGYFKLVGFEQDVEICESMVIPVLDYMERTINELRECYIGDTDFRIYKRDYCRGFAKGIEQQLKNAFIDMNIDKKYELILTDLHPAVIDYVKNEMNVNIKTHNFSNIDRDAYEHGVKDGSKYDLKACSKQQELEYSK